MSDIVDRLNDSLSAGYSELRKEAAREILQLRKERDALRAKIEVMENQEPPCGWWDDLIADISAIDCMYRGWPTYAHDAYWMREHVVQMFEHRRDAIPSAQPAPEAKP